MYLLQGYKPHAITEVMLREAVGGGSFSTIGPLREEWLQERIDETLNQYPAPPELLEQGQLVTKRLFAMSLKLAHDKFARDLEVIDVQAAENQQLMRLADALQARIATLETELLDNQRRFVGCIDSARQVFNEGCGGYLEVLSDSDEVLTIRFKGLQSAVNAAFDATREDQANLLSHYLLARQVGGEANSVSTTDAIAAEATGSAVRAQLRNLDS